MKRVALLLPFAIVGAAVAATACTADPVHRDAVKALGGEAPGVPVGDFHRAGQPCTVCHGPDGPADKQFSIAGTIFASPATLVGVDNAVIDLTDAQGSQHTTTTNCVGNFFIGPDEWSPHFPVLVRVQKGSSTRTMKTVIGRESSCAGCHTRQYTTANQFDYMPHIYLFGGDEPGGPAKDCPVNPDLGITP